MGIPKSVVRGWMPAIFGVGLSLALSGASPVYWLFMLPLLLIFGFMAALAEVRDEGQHILVDRLWRASHISKEDILATEESFLDGIGVLRLRQFVFPFGRIYFVKEWSISRRENGKASGWDLLASAILAISGFLGGRAALAVNIRGLAFELPHARSLALAVAGSLFFVFVATQKRKPGLAGGVLFVSAFILGLMRLW